MFAFSVRLGIVLFELSAQRSFHQQYVQIKQLKDRYFFQMEYSFRYPVSNAPHLIIEYMSIPRACNVPLIQSSTSKTVIYRSPTFTFTTIIWTCLFIYYNVNKMKGFGQNWDMPHTASRMIWTVPSMAPKCHQCPLKCHPLSHSLQNVTCTFQNEPRRKRACSTCNHCYFLGLIFLVSTIIVLSRHSDIHYATKGSNFFVLCNIRFWTKENS